TMTLSFFITVIPDHDKPQPPGCLLGKKNYVFFDSDHGGERGALLYGLIGTCRLNGIDPEAYLRHILGVLPEWPSNRVDELLPWNVALTNK
ncbi:transposase domain-containing protein, partial [Escherichia coli]